MVIAIDGPAGAGKSSVARAAAELGGDPEVVLREQTMRDERDRNREVAPLAPAPDAVPVDTTGLTLEQVVDQIVTLAVEAKELQT
jgi:cytidylate kinase